VFVIAADGSNERNVTNTSTAESGPMWSPDGTHLAYGTGPEGQPRQITTLRVDGQSLPGPPTAGPPSEWFVWSPDGKRLLWQVVTPLVGEAVQTTVNASDPEFREPPTALQVVDGLVVCAPSWQRLQP
jgi:Tol biopolymer transport system component